MGRLITIALAAALASGCATTADVEALESRVGQLESRMTANETQLAGFGDRVDRAQTTAADAARRAEAAEAQARSAADRADDAARKADAIFTKSVAK